MMHKSLYKIFHYIDSCEEDYIDKIDKKIILIYRNYNKPENVRNLLKLKRHCNSKGIKIVLSNNLKQAYNLKFDGVYLPAFNNQIINITNFRKNFMILGSAHNLKEIRNKEKQGVQKIIISPIFKTKNKNGLNIYKFNKLANLTKLQTIALGGINKNNIDKLKLIKIGGFASISYIRDKYDK